MGVPGGPALDTNTNTNGNTMNTALTVSPACTGLRVTLRIDADANARVFARGRMVGMIPAADTSAGWSRVVATTSHWTGRDASDVRAELWTRIAGE